MTPAGSTVTTGGKSYYVVKDSNANGGVKGIEIKSQGTATVTTTSSSGKISSTSATVINGYTYINGSRPSAGSVVTMGNNNYFVASDGKGGVIGQQITSASQVAIWKPASNPAGGAITYGWTVTAKSTADIKTYQYDGVAMGSTSSVLRSTGFSINSPVPIQEGGAKKQNESVIHHPLNGAVLDVNDKREVIRLQSWLAELGCLSPFENTNHRADGNFGINTQDGVKKFQAENGLTANGIVDKSTWDAIQSKYYQNSKENKRLTDIDVQMVNPVATMHSGDPYGYRIIEKGSPLHQGIDLRTGGVTDPILVTSTISGTVVSANEMGNRGNTVVILSDEIKDKNLYIVLQHLESMSVKVGDTVNRGEEIGIMGKTGLGSGVHLHMEVLVNPKFNYNNTSVTSPDYSMNPWLFLP